MSVFNGEFFLRESVESILGQSFRDFEFIIIDDGSTDRTAAILHTYQIKDSRLHVYQLEHKGLTDCLNYGCGMARGKYIARMDADDIAVRDRFLWQIEFMKSRPEVGVLGGAVEMISAEGSSLGIPQNPSEDKDIKAALIHDRNCALWHPTVLMRKKAFSAVHGYRKIVTNAEDYDLWLRMSERYQLANLARVVLKYRVYPRQTSISRCRPQTLSHLAAWAAAIARRKGQPDPLDNVREITPAILYKLGVTEAVWEATVASRYLWNVRNMLKAGEHEGAHGAIAELLHSPGSKCVDRRIIADLRLIAARLYWTQKRFGKSVLAAAEAVMFRPITIGRPLKSFLRRLWRYRLTANTASPRVGLEALSQTADQRKSKSEPNISNAEIFGNREKRMKYQRSR